MHQHHHKIQSIPATTWGSPSQSVFIFSHGRHGNKEEASYFANIAQRFGHQTLSFDLPKHGERINEDYDCSVQNGIHDFRIISEYADSRWATISFFGCSLGAYFGLLAYRDFPLGKCLLYSPVLDMERLIRNMMRALNVDEQLLQQRQTIDTPFGETLSWPYFDYVRNNKIHKWKHDTHVLHGSKDQMIETETVTQFCERFNCHLTTIDGAEHYFSDAEHLSMRDKWIETSL